MRELEHAEVTQRRLDGLGTTLTIDWGWQGASRRERVEVGKERAAMAEAAAFEATRRARR